MGCGEATHGAARHGQAFGRANGFFCCNGLLLGSRPGGSNGHFCGNGVFLGNRPGRSNGFQID